MKQFFKMFFASLLAMIIAGVILTGIFIGSIMALFSSAKSTRSEMLVKERSVLEIYLDKGLHEQGESNSLAALTGGKAYSVGLYDVIKAIRHAATDDKIKGILIRTGGSPNAWASMQQLRTALQEFKTSKKFIYAYGEDISQRDYFVASIADSVFLNPAGDIDVKGLASQLTFFKGSLEKLGVEAEIFYAGKFKSATEPFRADKISDANRQQLMALQHDIWSEYLTAAAAHCKTDTAAVHQWAQQGAIRFPEDALSKKLVDGLWYFDEVEQLLLTRTGRDKEKTASQDKDEGEKTPKVAFVEVDDYSNSMPDDETESDDRIAILFAEGDIVDGAGTDYQVASESIVKDIRKVRDDKKVKAVVLRVNSPGGSARASEVILRELQLLRKKKPLIVSMGDVAASGGYYIACQADSIFALPTTITGSIGVFTMLFNVEPLMNNKLGITFDEVKNAPYADFPTGSRPLTADEQKLMQQGVDTIYALFKRRVAAGRKITEAEVDSIAQGRVWTGKTALQLKLVDGLGSMDRALKAAAALGKIKDYEIVTYPDPVDRIQRLMRRFGTASASATVRAAVQEELGVDYAWFLNLKKIQGMNGREQMLMPFRFNID